MSWCYLHPLQTFNTGTSTGVSTTPGVNFTKSMVYTGAPISSSHQSDGRLYAAGLDGSVRRWTIEVVAI